MIEKIIKHFKNKDEPLIIFDIGSSDCNQSIEFYKQFPNSKIYSFGCKSNTFEICKKNIEHYCDRITLIDCDVCDYDGNIDICYINENEFGFIENKIILNKVKLLINDAKILFDNSKKQVILVSAGNFQEYIKTNIDQLLKFNFDIHIIIDNAFFKYMKDYKNLVNLVDANELHTDFDNKQTPNKSFRNGFWHYTSKRLFLVNEYIKKYNIKNVIHIENDVLLYSDMNYDFDKKIYITMDSNNRCIPGIIYIPSYELFNKLIEKYDYSKNDMVNLGIFYHNNKDIVTTFPIFNNSIEKNIYNENFEKFDSIFDGAAMGQYLGGVDPLNKAGDTTGFVNETCVIKYDKYIFEWVKNGLYYVPYIKINNSMVLINNLHIHSKNLQRFSVDNPCENKFIVKHI